jgi:hypothetical protein
MHSSGVPGSAIPAEDDMTLCQPDFRNKNRYQIGCTSQPPKEATGATRLRA